MILCLALVAASIALHFASHTLVKLGSALPLSDNQYIFLLWYLKWALTLWAIVDLNSILNRWAENRWQWTADTSAWDWEKEIAVVTGGARGIGACVAKGLVSHGMRCAVLDVVPLAPTFTEEELRLIRYFKCDITSPSALHIVAEAIRSDMGSPSILINNAGIGNASPILELPFENLQRLFQINILSHFSTVKEFLPDMLARKKGHIMSVASLASFVSLAGAVDYSCTKSGLLAFHEGLGQELKHRYKCPEIKTSIIHPGWARTAITEHPAIMAGLKSTKAKLLEPEDVANAMVKQIIAAKSGQVVLGPSISPKLRAFPSWIQELIRDSQAKVVSGSGTTG